MPEGIANRRLSQPPKSGAWGLLGAVAAIIDSEIANGRYKDVSAALNDAAWHHFIGVPSPFAEYGVTAEEVERSARRDLGQIKADRKTGKLISL